MRRNVLIIASFVVALNLSGVGRFVWPTTAGEPDQPASVPPTEVALLNLACVFANHAEFNRRSKSLRQEVEKADSEQKLRKAELQLVTDQLAKLEKGSAEYREYEAEINRLQAQLRADVEKYKHDFAQRDAKLYLETHQQIMAEVGKLARARGIDLVIRFYDNRVDEVDPVFRTTGIDGKMGAHRGEQRHRGGNLFGERRCLGSGEYSMGRSRRRWRWMRCVA